MMAKRRMTAARRRQIHMAQMMSARKRKKRSSDTIGHWVAKGARKVVSMATMGTSSALVEFMDGARVAKRRKLEQRNKEYRRRKGR